jgi:LPS export ABC transporter protein LptC
MRRLRTLATTCFSTLALAACDEQVSRPIAGDELTRIDADNVQYDMRSIFTAEGVRSGYVTADSAFVYADSSRVRMYGVEIVFEDTRGVEQARVVADSGSLVQRTEEMDAYGNVVVELPLRGCRITSEEIHYSPPNQQIRSDTPVRFEQNGIVATGAGFESDLQMNNFRILEPRGALFDVCSNPSSRRDGP